MNATRSFYRRWFLRPEVSRAENIAAHFAPVAAGLFAYGQYREYKNGKKLEAAIASGRFQIDTKELEDVTKQVNRQLAKLGAEVQSFDITASHGKVRMQYDVNFNLASNGEDGK